MATTVSILDAILNNLNELDHKTLDDSDLSSHEVKSFEKTQDINEKLIIFHTWLNILKHLLPPNSNNFFIPRILDRLNEDVKLFLCFFKAESDEINEKIKSIECGIFIVCLKDIFKEIELAKINFEEAEKHKNKNAAEKYNKWYFQYLSRLFDIGEKLDEALTQLSPSSKDIGLTKIKSKEYLAKRKSIADTLLSNSKIEYSSDSKDLEDIDDSQKNKIFKQKRRMPIFDAENNPEKRQNSPSSSKKIDRLLFKSKISGHLQSEEALEELCKDFSSSSIGLEVTYITKIRSKKYKKDSDLNSHLEDSVGNLYDYLKDQDKLIAFIDWLSKTIYRAVKNDLEMN